MADVAEVTVAKDGTLRVDRVVVAVDCGQVINPDLVAARIEGGVVFGPTAALYDEITIQGGQVQQSNFDNYQMLRIANVPKVEGHLVPSHEPPPPSRMQFLRRRASECGGYRFKRRK